MARDRNAGSGVIRSIVAGGLAAAIPLAFYWGFTVDDALIPARYAHHIARGAGYVFNVGSPPSDGVTPLGFPYVLALAAKPGPLAALAFARALGAAAWVVASALLGLAVLRVGGSRWRFLSLLLVLCSAPLAAWSQAGLETGIVAALVATALFLRSGSHHYAAAATVGLAAAMRPELLPMALVLAFPRGAGAPGDERTSISPAHFGRLAVAAAPFAAVALVRLAIFGRAAPLSLYAKPPDVSLGAKYALACLILTGPVAVLAPLAWARLAPWPRWLVVATAVHFAAVTFAGGDWMPLSRLVVPALPVVVLAAAHVAAKAEPAFTVGRFILALTAESVTFVRMRESSARVFDERSALIREVAPHLRERKAVATVDVGWVGAATDATVIDLAGVTDPFVAFLPGSHTTKRIPDSLVDERRADTLVFLLQPGRDVTERWSESPFNYGVERWVALAPGMEEAFAVDYVSTGRLHYVVLTRTEEVVALGDRPAEPGSTVR